MENVFHPLNDLSEIEVGLGDLQQEVPNQGPPIPDVLRMRNQDEDQEEDVEASLNQIHDELEALGFVNPNAGHNNLDMLQFVNAVPFEPANAQARVAVVPNPRPNVFRGQPLPFDQFIGAPPLIFGPQSLMFNAVGHTQYHLPNPNLFQAIYSPMPRGFPANHPPPRFPPAIEGAAGPQWLLGHTEYYRPAGVNNVFIGYYGPPPQVFGYPRP